jgi:hypothetical protein
MPYVIYNDSECHTPKLSTFLAFYPSAGAPERQFARAPVLPERQFCQSASFPERQLHVPDWRSGKTNLLTL